MCSGQCVVRGCRWGGVMRGDMVGRCVEGRSVEVRWGINGVAMCGVVWKDLVEEVWRGNLGICDVGCSVVGKVWWWRYGGGGVVVEVWGGNLGICDVGCSVVWKV